VWSRDEVAPRARRRADLRTLDLFRSRSPGGRALRILVPAALLLSLLGGLIQEWLEQGATVGTRSALWASVVIVMCIAVGVVVWAARSVEDLARVAHGEHERHQDLFDSIPDGIFETSIDGLPHVVNVPLAAMLGYADDDEVLDSVQDVRQLWADPRDREHLVQRIVDGEHAGVTEARLRRRDGTIITAILSWRVWLAPDGSVGGLRGTIRDISDEVASRTRLTEVEEQYRLAFELGPMGRAVIEIETGSLRFLQVNDALAGLLGYTIPELLDTYPFALVHPEDFANEALAFECCVRGDAESVSLATRRRHRDGSWIPVWLTGLVVRADDGSARYAMATIEDLRPRLAAEAATTSAWDEAIHRIAVAVEFRDEETGSHVVRMAHVCRLIADELGFEPERAALLERAAQLHDAGKVAIPDNILLKPGRLTDEERAVMQTHTTVGHDLLAGTGSDVLELAADIAWTHHERLDGTGYPRGLADGEIPIEGRIAAVADVYDAVTSDRVYRPAMSTERALAILEEGRGSLFDPVVLDAFLACLARPEDRDLRPVFELSQPADEELVADSRERR
jgi:PAS domain S-box-containing protein